MPFSELISNPALVFTSAVGIGLFIRVLIRKKLFPFFGNTPDVRTYRTFRDVKMVLVVQNGLKMSKGKVAAQCGHACVACYKQAMKDVPDLVKSWEKNGQPKIVLKVEDEAELLEIYQKAVNLSLNVAIISDAGRTQIPAGSKTVIGIGPAPNLQVNAITGHLKLL